MSFKIAYVDAQEDVAATSVDIQLTQNLTFPSLFNSSTLSGRRARKAKHKPRLHIHLTLSTSASSLGMRFLSFASFL